MKNILIFSHRAFPLSATFIYRQVQAATTQYSIHLVTLEELNEANFPLPGVNKWVMKSYYGFLDRVLFYVQKRRSRYAPKFSRAAQEKLIQFTKRNNINIIHIHYGTWAVHLLPALKRLNIPFIVSFHGYDASSALKKGTYAARLPELFGMAVRIAIVSDHMRSTLKLDIWNNKVFLVPYGIDDNVFSPPSTKRPDHELKILHSGRLTPKKGVTDLIRVFSQLRDNYANIALHILGDGEQMDECVALVNEFSLSDSVKFYGSKPLSNVIALMGECHIFVLNSRIADNGDMEGLPNSILEAMSMEMAVVSTKHAGIPMAITDNQTGLLVPERDNDSLLQALKKLIDDSNLRLRLGTEARQKIRSEFTSQRMTSKLLSLYDNLE